MSKGVINGAVRIGQTTYKAGDEEAFAAAASQGQIKHLSKKGAISGDFTSGKKASKSEAPAVEVETADEPVADEVEAPDAEAETAEEAPKGKTKGRGKK